MKVLPLFNFEPPREPQFTDASGVLSYGHKGNVRSFRSRWWFPTLLDFVLLLFAFAILVVNAVA